MKYSILFTLSFLFCFSQNIFSQTQKTKKSQNLKSEQLAAPSSILKDIRTLPKAPKTILENPLKNFKSTIPFSKNTDNQRFIKIKKDESTGLPIWIHGKLENAPQQRSASIESRTINYLEALKEPLQIENPAEEFFIQKINTDKLGQQHIRMQQQFQGIKIYNSEIIAHAKDNDIYLVNGRYYPTPQLENLTPSVDVQGAEQIARDDVGTFKTLSFEEKKYVAGEQFETELVIFFPEKNITNPKLAYHLTVIPNMTERWEYLIDAENGNVLNKYSSICKFHLTATDIESASDLNSHKDCSHNHTNNLGKSEAESKPVAISELVNGPFTANETDLLGINRTINTYEVNGTYFMYDGSRPMFDVNSDLPSDPKGMIVTVDGLGTYPNNSNFDYSVITSSNNSWNYPAAVSAHYNGGEAYEYFKSTHNRESINGQGGTIISFFNISDENGSDMDNAFWNGAAMFYGNGNQAFNFPLQRALDVAGHEMSHGVIQGTANLEYQGQSGAMNESFADIFGAMIDRDDWQMGEDITNPNYISTGALRSLSDPNNGGSSLNTPGWQPKTMAEYQNLPNTPQGDNGGVHINSGITNYAYYLFATDIGKDKAELIYYKALDDYLVKSSQFVDLRNAVVQAASELHGSASAEVNAANAAFDAVGIGQGSGGTYQNDVNLNDGDERILHSDAGLDKLYLADLAGTNLADPQLSLTNVTSKPSITDNGKVIVFVDDENNIKYIDIDWATGITDEGYLETNPSGEWRNIAISKDGTRIAAVRTNAENIIWVYDFNLASWNQFELYNPTTSNPNGGIVTTGEVQYADAMEFDFSGEYLMYDAFNQVASSQGNNAVEYWDIGFLNVFGNGNFATGNIEKLFAGLPSGVSIGNPTFAKNSPYIVAFDFREEGFFSDNYQIWGANIQTGDNEVIREGETWAYPNYSVNDEQMIFDLPYQGTTVLGKININANKISGDAASEDFLFPNGTIAEKWGIWFATGERDLVANENIELTELNGKIYPNPFDENLILEMEGEQNEKTMIHVFNLLGQSVFEQSINISLGKNKFDLNLKSLNAGTYFIQLQLEKGNVMMKVVKN
ncbi:MAG: M4 family metallopeptidase [Saprospiraceae bacterium]